MSEILLEENAIILAAAQKMVSLGSEASQAIIEGNEAKLQDAQGEKILRLLTSYRRKTALDDKQLESILYCLRSLSEDTVFPTISPIVGQDITYIGATITDGHWVDQGNWDASTNLFPDTAVKRSYTWNVTVAGVLGGTSVEPGAVIRALINNPGQILANWSITY